MRNQENKQLWAELVSKVTPSTETTCFQPEEGFIFDQSQPLFSLLMSSSEQRQKNKEQKA
jgi:hypothetical protein